MSEKPLERCPTNDRIHGHSSVTSSMTSASFFSGSFHRRRFCSHFVHLKFFFVVEKMEFLQVWDLKFEFFSVLYLLLMGLLNLVVNQRQHRHHLALKGENPTIFGWRQGSRAKGRHRLRAAQLLFVLLKGK